MSFEKTGSSSLFVIPCERGNGMSTGILDDFFLAEDPEGKLHITNFSLAELDPVIKSSYEHNKREYSDHIVSVQEQPMFCLSG